MVDTLKSEVHSATTWSIIVSILMICTGILAVALPQLAGLAVTVCLAWLLVFSAALHLVFAWRSGPGRHIVWELLLGVVYGATGIYVLAHPVAGLVSFTLVIAVYLVLEGIIECGLAAQLGRGAGSGWILLDGVITLALAVLVAATWPSSAVWVVGTLAGISMLFSGAARLMFSLAARQALA